MGRIFAIDYGKKRVGFAVTDPLQIIASPLTTVPEQEAITFISKYIKEEEVDTIVIGMPFKLSGEPTHATPLVEAFIKRLQKFIPTKIVTEDESYTSKRAVEVMIAAGIKKKERRVKSNVDKISASLILQSYLDSITNE